MLKSINLSRTSTVDYVGHVFISDPEIAMEKGRERDTQRKRERERDRERNISLRLDGTVQRVLFFVNPGCETVQLEYGLDMIGWFLSCIHFATNEQHQQHHSTTQNTSKQLAQCSFDHICYCMDPVLFSNVVTETRTVDDVGQGFHEVGRYGKTCLYSL